MKFKKVLDGEWVYPKRRGYKMQCCDCGLVHTVNFELIKKGRGKAIVFQAFRDDALTKKERRKRK